MSLAKGSLFFLALLPLQCVLGDLPVHCVRHQILGEWSFHLSGLQDKRTSCGHQRPDVETVQPQSEPQVAEVKQITLSDLNLAKTDKDSQGNYTMIYDEGFEVRVEDLVFFAFSRYDFVKDKAGNQKNMSRCGETHRGWYRDASRTRWGCYVAKKVDQSDVSLLQVVPDMHQVTTSPNYDKATTLEWHEKRAHHLNLMQTSWKARVYDQFVGLSLRELNSYAGIRRHMPQQQHAGHRVQRSLLETSHFRCPEMQVMHHSKPGEVLPKLLLKGQKPCQLRQQVEVYQKPVDQAALDAERKLPTKFDWRDARGNQNFIEPVMDQADCGSCYMVSTMRMLSARHKITTNNSKAEPWSISFPLHCSEYNQGCKGGYAFLASKWSEDVGLVPASCAPYDVAGTCQLKCDPNKLSKRYRASGHRYVGGFYGNSSTANIMQELYNNGPLVVSFEPSDDFMFYSGGVFTQLKSGVPAPLHMTNTEWQQVDHAVLLIGWGEDMGQKYWLVQNSWGDQWGEAGYFRIARDINDSGIESIVVASDVVEDDRPTVMQDFMVQNTKL